MYNYYIIGIYGLPMLQTTSDEIVSTNQIYIMKVGLYYNVLSYPLTIVALLKRIIVRL